MRYVRIFLLHFQDCFHSRGRSFVWFVVSFINPLLLLLFWQGVAREYGSIGGGQWSPSAITSYYLLLGVATSFLIVHIEEDVAWRDIKEGQLAKYLLRPFSYFGMKFMEEIPWRILQGSFGLTIFLFIRFVLNVDLPLVTDIGLAALAACIIMLAYCISFTLKMILGLTAFWTTDFWGTLSIEEVTMLIFGGIASPIMLYPEYLAQLSYFLPFAYILYFPVIAIEGLLSAENMLGVIGVQVVWVVVLYGVYQFIWNKGKTKFSAIGQ